MVGIERGAGFSSIDEMEEYAQFEDDILGGKKFIRW
jgi:hypothetical protein